MRGPGIQQDALISTVGPETRVPKDHPLRPIRQMVDKALKEMDEDFNALYADSGRDSIPPRNCCGRAKTAKTGSKTGSENNIH